MIVQAVDGTMQGVASEPIQFTMPLARTTAKVILAAETAAATPTATNGGNGHTNDSRLPALG